MIKINNFDDAINHAMELIETVDNEDLQDELMYSLDEISYYYAVLLEDNDNLENLLEQEKEWRYR